MIRPFKKHQQMVHALQSGASIAAQSTAAPPEPSSDTESGQEYAALRVLLHDNLRTLSDVQSIEARNPMKVEMARHFAPWIEGALKAGEQGLAAQDEILVTNMIWAIDYRDFDYALTLAAHVLKYNLVLPERYKRTPACFVAEEIATIALDQHEAVCLEHLIQTRTLVDGADMPDPVMAKLLKAIGRAWERRAESFDAAADNAPAGGKAAYLDEALTQLKRAFELDRTVGVKKDIERTERALKAATLAADQDL
ncbi:Phage small terminase subunit [Novosphingobium sp. CF614]|uniref:phage terminase small subunit n=1 Tax=Novosphingobium sp. CF614 TaxID=1884364 RepID=UPI0008E347C4|nr:phage terminase small subunit [Novosphingobium sp. CF614]SFG08333.1 Phage small terminase subunit [Novosphingobium sp. CF614]